MRNLCFAFVILIFTGCSSIYEQNFDCPPGKGVPCTSVTDLEAMIVETQEGPDVFEGRTWGSDSYRDNKPRRIWVRDYSKVKGCCSGYYVKLPCIGEQGESDASIP